MPDFDLEQIDRLLTTTRSPAPRLRQTRSALHLRQEREAADLLGIPDSVMQVALLPVAHYRGHGFRAAERKDAAEVTYWDRWGDKRPPAVQG